MDRQGTLLCMALCAGLAVAGCAKKPRAVVPEPAPPVAEAPPPPPALPPPAPPAPAAAAPALSEDEIFARKTLDELNAERPLDIVYFAYDRADLGDDARGLLTRNAEWLRRWPSTRIAVEGHSDERGTAEYNLALGERRAQAVHAYLVSLGVDGSRVQTLSKGKEAPACLDPNEACWQRNRRGVSTITAK